MTTVYILLGTLCALALLGLSQRWLKDQQEAFAEVGSIDTTTEVLASTSRPTDVLEANLASAFRRTQFGIFERDERHALDFNN